MEEFRTAISVLDLTTGQASRLDKPEVLTAFVERWQDELSQAVIDAYPPLHDLHLTGEEEAALGSLLRRM